MSTATVDEMVEECQELVQKKLTAREVGTDGIEMQRCERRGW